MALWNAVALEHFEVDLRAVQNNLTDISLSKPGDGRSALSNKTNLYAKPKPNVGLPIMKAKHTKQKSKKKLSIRKAPKQQPLIRIEPKPPASSSFLPLPTPNFNNMTINHDRSDIGPLTPEQMQLPLSSCVMSPIKKNLLPGGVCSPSRARTPSKGILSPQAPTGNKPWSPRKKINFNFSFDLDEVETVTEFALLPESDPYDSDDYLDDDERFPVWARGITDLDLRCSNKATYDKYFTQHPVQNLEPKNLSRGLFSTEVNNGRQRFASIKDFAIGRPVGAGKYGTIYAAKAKVDQPLIVAIKVMWKTNMQTQHVTQLLREIKHLDMLRHENVISLYDFFHDATRIYLVMEYAAGGDLYHRLCQKKRFPEPEAAKIFQQAVFAIRTCHQKDIIHRDIKPENFVFGTGNVLKLIDFGWSGPCSSNDRRTTLCGTLDYLAPELVISRPYGQHIDVWCLGVLLYELLTGSPPFEDEDVVVTKMNIKYVSYRLPDYLSPQVKSLLGDILKYDPLSRPTLSQLLSHPWVTSHI